MKILQVTGKDIKVTGEAKYILVSGQAGVDTIRFIVPRTYDGIDGTIDLGDYPSWYLRFKNAKNEGEPVLLESVTVNDTTITIDWTPSGTSIQESGDLMVQLWAYLDDAHQWPTSICHFWVQGSLPADSNITPTGPTVFEQYLTLIKAQHDSVVSDAADAATEAAQAALDSKVDKVSGKGLSTEDYTTEEKTKLSNIEAGAQVNTVTKVAGKTGDVTLGKSDVGLSNVDDTSDINKPVSTATQTALDLKIPLSQKGEASGVATLGTDGKVPASQLPSYVDDVLEYATSSAFPATGETGKIYVALDTNLTYRWSGSAYVEISQSLALGETEQTAYRGDRGKIAYDHSQATGNPHGMVKSDLSLGNVDNTSDADKPVSTAQQAALDLKVAKSDIVDNLESTDATKVLSAKQGKTLKEEIDTLLQMHGGLFGFEKNLSDGTITALGIGATLGVMPVVEGSKDESFANPYRDYALFNFRSCLMDKNQNILAYYGQTGYDMPAAESDTYQVQVPKGYVRIYFDSTYMYVLISPVKLSGFWCPGNFLNDDGTEKDYDYIGKYKQSRVLVGGTYYSRSRPDEVPETEASMATYESHAEAISDTYLWNMASYYQNQYLTYLMWAAGQSTNSQAAYGNGMSSMRYQNTDTFTVAADQTDVSSITVATTLAANYHATEYATIGTSAYSGRQIFWAKRILSIVDNGDDTSTITFDVTFSLTAGVTYYLGEDKQGTPQIEADYIGEESGWYEHDGRTNSAMRCESFFLGIAGIQGNVYEWQNGVLLLDSIPYVNWKRKYMNYFGDPTVASASNNYVKASDTVVLQTNGYIKNMYLVGSDATAVLLPSEGGAGSTTHFADYYYVTTTGLRGLLLFGSWGSGSHAGRSCTDFSYAPSDTRWYIGWRSSASKELKAA